MGSPVGPLWYLLASIEYIKCLKLSHFLSSIPLPLPLSFLPPSLPLSFSLSPPLLLSSLSLPPSLLPFLSPHCHSLPLSSPSSLLTLSLPPSLLPFLSPLPLSPFSLPFLSPPLPLSSSSSLLPLSLPPSLLPLPPNRSALNVTPPLRRMVVVTMWCVPHVRQSSVGSAWEPGNPMAPVGESLCVGMFGCGYVWVCVGMHTCITALAGISVIVLTRRTQRQHEMHKL